MELESPFITLLNTAESNVVRHKSVNMKLWSSDALKTKHAASFTFTMRLVEEELSYCINYLNIIAYKCFASCLKIEIDVLMRFFQLNYLLNLMLASC